MSAITFVLEEFDDFEFIFGSEPDPGAEVFLVIGQRGPQGEPGPSADSGLLIVTRLAGEDLGGHRGVKIALDGLAYYAEPTDEDIEATIGVTTGAAEEQATVDIQTGGGMEEGGWDWAPGGSIYLGEDGVLTQVVPTEGAVYRLGTATGSTTIVIDPRLVARFSEE